MCRILETIGCIVVWDKNEVRIDATAVKTSRLPEEYVTMMRSSVMLMGPMLGRIGEVSLHYPGGCVIGDRPIDIHLKACLLYTSYGQACRIYNRRKNRYG